MADKLADKLKGTPSGREATKTNTTATSPVTVDTPTVPKLK